MIVDERPRIKIKKFDNEDLKLAEQRTTSPVVNIENQQQKEIQELR